MAMDGFHSDVIISLGLLSFYLYEVEDDPEIHISTSFRFLN